MFLLVVICDKKKKIFLSKILDKIKIKYEEICFIEFLFCLLYN